MIHEFRGKRPDVDDSCFIAESAQVIGRVTLREGSSVWFNAVVRGDSNSITIGRGTNVQDLSVLHVDGENALEIGEDVTVGHHAVIHGCAIRDRTMIGMGAIVMNGAEIGEGSIVGAGALVPEGMKVPPRSLVLGVPAKVKREVTDEELAMVVENAKHYCDLAKVYHQAGL